MRLHTFTLVVFTAVLAHSATFWKTSNSTKTEGAPSASLRSSDACCDDVPVEQGLGPHETTAGEERTPELHILSKINEEVAHFVELVYAHECKTMPAVEHLPVYGQRVFDENAVKYSIRFNVGHMTPTKLLENAKLLTIGLRMMPEDGPGLIAKARQSFLAHQVIIGVEAHQFLAYQAELTADTHNNLLGRQAELTAKADQFFLAHQAKTTAEAGQLFLAHQAKMTEEAYKFVLAHEAKMTAEARQYFLAYQAEMTADARQYFLVDLAEMTAKADQIYLAQQAELGEEAILRYEMDPSAYFNIMFQKAKADALKRADGRNRSPITSLDLGSLDKYMQKYNTIHGCDLTLRKVMSRCICDDAEFASILSIMSLNQKNKKYVATVRLEPIFADSKTVGEAAVKLGIPPGTTEVLDNKNVDLFVRFTAIFAREHAGQHSVIVKQLTDMFGGRQAALLVYKMNWKWKASYAALKEALYKYLEEKGTTLDMLRDEIMRAREKRGGSPRKIW
ncbi:unnamed protein product [Hyaloperonospora brassicae]|uniref:RxLR effector candidate protein n=1 Tax=Hyaloperonospora brassicae TaxID=162125 RepID=A0AAV0U5Y1_HYABA|nr:unnamed protein product [Hyaloperonospora brassicae]